MLTGDYMKARECYHDAVSVQQAHQPRLESLLLYWKHKLNETLLPVCDLGGNVCLYPLNFSSLMMCGVLAAMFEHYDEAKTFLERATGIEPPSVVAWTLLGEMKVSLLTNYCLTCASP